MTPSNIPDDRRVFHCVYCGGQILIPRNLPPTAGPCPHCSKTVTSPPPDDLDGDDFAASGLPRLTKRAGDVKRLGPEHIVDDLEEIEKTPIKLGVEQYVDDTPKMKPAKPRKEAPNKPVVSRTTAQQDISSDHRTPFEQFLIDEARYHGRKMVATAVVIALLALSGGGYFYYYIRQKKTDPLKIDIADAHGSRFDLTEAYISAGWERDARNLLRGFINARTAYNKSQYILNADAILPELEKFYDGGLVNDTDTPAEAFSPNPLSPDEQQRGLFRMSFRGGTPEPSGEPQKIPPVSRPYIIDPDKPAKQPMCVDAFFLLTPTGLKLDWHLFVQTKYRSLHQFATRPSPKRKQAFRVVITQDPVNPADGASNRYRIADPANPTDAIWATVGTGSSAAKALAAINWAGNPGRQPVSRHATIELAWRGDGEDRELVIHNFLCWEFIGLAAAPPQNPAPGSNTP